MNGKNKSKHTCVDDIKSNAFNACPIDSVESIVRTALILDDKLCNGVSRDLGFNADLGNIFNLFVGCYMYFVMKLVRIGMEYVFKLDLGNAVTIRFYKRNIGYRNILLDFAKLVHINTLRL